MPDGKYVRLACLAVGKLSLARGLGHGGKRLGAGRPRLKPMIFGPPRRKGRPKGSKSEIPRKPYTFKAAEMRLCAFCGSQFLAGASSHAKFCGRRCGVAFSNAKKQDLSKSDPLAAATDAARKIVRCALNRRGVPRSKRTLEVLGCSFDEFRLHLERQFVNGMSWANRSEWHIDHITPLASAKTAEEVMRLNHFTNLRPLWAKENQSKGSKPILLI